MEKRRFSIRNLILGTLAAVVVVVLLWAGFFALTTPLRPVSSAPVGSPTPAPAITARPAPSQPSSLSTLPPAPSVEPSPSPSPDPSLPPAPSSTPRPSASLPPAPSLPPILPPRSPSPRPSPSSSPGGSPGPSVSPGPSPSPVLVPLPALRPQVTGATMSYLAISGKTAPALFAAASRIGTLVPGADAWGSTSASFTTSEQNDTPPDGGCLVSHYLINATYTVLLPAWGSPAIVPASLLSWWQVVLNHITDHETRHVQIWQNAVAALPGLMNGARCLDEPNIYASWLANAKAAQAAWDAAEAPWQPPVYAGPPAP